MFSSRFHGRRRLLIINIHLHNNIYIYIYISIVFVCHGEIGLPAKGIIVRVPRRPRCLDRCRRRSSFRWFSQLGSRASHVPRWLIRRPGATLGSSQSHPPDTSWPDIGSMPGSRCSWVADPFLFMVAGREVLAATLSSVVDGVSGAAGTTSQTTQTNLSTGRTLATNSRK